MLYLMAKRDCYDYFNKFSVVKNQLLTHKEHERKCPYISMSNFYKIELKKTHTYTNFGCRFPVSDSLIYFHDDLKFFIFAGSGTNGKLYETIFGGRKS